MHISGKKEKQENKQIMFLYISVVFVHPCIKKCINYLKRIQGLEDRCIRNKHGTTQSNTELSTELKLWIIALEKFKSIQDRLCVSTE